MPALTASGLGCIAGETGGRGEPVQLPEGLVPAGNDFPVGPTSLGSVRKTNRSIVSQSDLWWDCFLLVPGTLGEGIQVAHIPHPLEGIQPHPRYRSRLCISQTPSLLPHLQLRGSLRNCQVTRDLPRTISRLTVSLLGPYDAPASAGLPGLRQLRVYLPLVL